MARSPRFRFRFQHLRKFLTESNLKKIWKDHIRAANREQIIYDLADYYDVHHDIGDYISESIKNITAGFYKPQPPIRVSLEKSKGLCRHITIPHPIDSLILQASVNNIMPSLLGGQPSKKAFYQPQSHRFTRSRAARLLASEYGSLQSWLAFQKEVFNFAKSYRYVAVTDVSNFFDSIEFDQLKSIISANDGVQEPVVDMILYIFESYCWRPDYMPQALRGLPQMNFDAPRLLAHCMLFELDTYITSNSLIDYVRFMDDIDIGVNDTGTAKKILRNIDTTLHTRGLRLNAGKTRIMSGAEAALYYFVDDNWKLDTVEQIIEAKRKRLKCATLHNQISKERAFIQSKLERDLLKPGYFDKGNGEKVLKRYVNLAIKLNISISRDILRDILFNRPSLREIACRYICFSGYSSAHLEILEEYVLSNHCTDGASNYLIAKTLVDLNCPNSRKVIKRIRSIAEQIAARGQVGFAAAIWLLSKYGTQKELMGAIQSHRDIWMHQDWLGRQVGALYPRFRSNRTLFLKFREEIRSSRNYGALAVFGFHSRIMRNQVRALDLLNYLKATSPSQPNGITHQKILLSMTMLKSSINHQSRNSLSSTYNGLELDSVQKSLLRGLI